MIWQLFSKIGAKVKKLPEILPPLENPLSYQYHYENDFATGTFISRDNEKWHMKRYEI